MKIIYFTFFISVQLNIITQTRINLKTYIYSSVVVWKTTRVMLDTIANTSANTDLKPAC